MLASHSWMPTCKTRTHNLAIVSICLLREGLAVLAEPSRLSWNFTPADASSVPSGPAATLATVLLAMKPAHGMSKYRRRSADTFAKLTKKDRRELAAIQNAFVNRSLAAADLDEALSLLDEAKTMEHFGKVGFGAVVNAVERKSVEENVSARVPELLQATEDILKLATRMYQGKFPEPAVATIARILCLCESCQHALRFIEEARIAGTALKVRTFAAVLALAVEAGDRSTCTLIWKRLGTLQLEPRESEFALMLRCLRGDHLWQLEIIRDFQERRMLPSEPALVEELGRVFGVPDVAALSDAGTVFADGLKAGANIWRVGWSSVDDTGFCSLSKRTLQEFDISPAEESLLLARVPKLAITSPHAGKEFREFIRWLERNEPFDVIIDAANVAFCNQNYENGHFRYHFIELVAQHFRSQGKRALIVLHEKWLRDTVDLNPRHRKKVKFGQISLDPKTSELVDVYEERTSTVSVPLGEHGDMASRGDKSPVSVPLEAEDHVAQEHAASLDDTSTLIATHEIDVNSEPSSLMRSWAESGCAYFPSGYDDWYWLYAALDSFRRGKRKVQVVSNDFMKDHHWRMFSDASFTRWQERHMLRYTINYDDEDLSNLTFRPFRINPYSSYPQVSADENAWHFPVRVHSEIEDDESSGTDTGDEQDEASDIDGGEANDEAYEGRWPWKAESPKCRWLVAWKEEAATAQEEPTNEAASRKPLAEEHEAEEAAKTIVAETEEETKVAKKEAKLSSYFRYLDKTLVQLKELCRVRKLKVSGRKSELIQRLLDSEIDEERPEDNQQSEAVFASIPEELLEAYREEALQA